MAQLILQAGAMGKGGEIFILDMGRPVRIQDMARDLIRLSGLEPGRNRLGRVDSMRRHIYIHGTPDSEPMGEPRSHGCVRMRNADVIALFDLVANGCPVTIRDGNDAG